GSPPSKTLPAAPANPSSPVFSIATLSPGSILLFREPGIPPSISPPRFTMGASTFPSFSAIIPAHGLPAPLGNPSRVRSSLLGCQHLRDLRAPFLLRCLLFAGSLPPGKTQLLHRSNHHSRRHLRGCRLVSGDFRWDRRRLARLSPCAFSRLFDPQWSLFP